MTNRMITRALLSVSDKTGIVEFGQALQKHGVELLSTGGTARALREAGLTVVDVSEHTGHKEVFGGRVKTLHPKVHGGILFRRGHEEDERTAQQEGIGPIDLVCVNLYPFEQVAAKPDAAFTELIENIDIGGPSMLRSAAKNHAAVTVLTDPADYDKVVDALDDGGPDDTVRRDLALKAFARTAAYDAAISTTLAARVGGDDAGTGVPDQLALAYPTSSALRYGENPHQAARVYATSGAALPLAGTAPLQGKALSYNNLLDADAAIFSLRAITQGAAPKPAAVVIKHLTPCGAAYGETLLEAFERAKAGDSKSAFGGIVSLSQECDEATAHALGEMFLEVVIAPGFSEGARAALGKKKNLRLLALPTLLSAPEDDLTMRSVYGGMLAQQADRPFLGLREAQVVTERAPREKEWQALDFAFRTVVAVKSNAITLAHAGQLIAAGGGQTSRVDAVELAVKKALEHHHNPKGAALGSDAFFPFPDGVVAAAEAGITAIAQPGGSKRDNESIEAANRLGLTMVFTGERHFRH